MINGEIWQLDYHPAVETWSFSNLFDAEINLRDYSFVVAIYVY